MSLVSSPEEALRIINNEDEHWPLGPPVTVGDHIPGFTRHPEMEAMPHFVVKHYPGSFDDEGNHVGASHYREEEMRAQKLLWVLLNCNGRWSCYDSGYVWKFELEEDAMLFKFVWQDEPLYQGWVENYVSPLGDLVKKIKYKPRAVFS